MKGEWLSRPSRDSAANGTAGLKEPTIRRLMVDADIEEASRVKDKDGG